MKKSIISLSTLISAALLWGCSAAPADDSQEIGYFDESTGTYGFMTADGEFITDTSLHAMPGIMVNGLVAVGNPDSASSDSTASRCYTLMAKSSDGTLSPLVSHLSSCGYYAEGRIPTATHGGDIIVRDGEGRPVFRLDSIGPLKVTRCASAYSYGLLTFELHDGTAAAVDTDGRLVIPPFADGSKVISICPGENLTAVMLDNNSSLMVDRNGEHKCTLNRKGWQVDVEEDTILNYTYGPDGISYIAFNLNGDSIGAGNIDAPAHMRRYIVKDSTATVTADGRETKAYLDSTNILKASRVRIEPNITLYPKFLRVTKSPADPAILIAAWNKALADRTMAESMLHYRVNWMPVLYVYPGKTACKAAGGCAPASESTSEIPGISIDSSTLSEIANEQSIARYRAGIPLTNRYSSGPALSPREMNDLSADNLNGPVKMVITTGYLEEEACTDTTYYNTDGNVALIRSGNGSWTKYDYPTPCSCVATTHDGDIIEWSYSYSDRARTRQMVRHANSEFDDYYTLNNLTEVFGPHGRIIMEFQDRSGWPLVTGYLYSEEYFNGNCYALPSSTHTSHVDGGPFIEVTDYQYLQLDSYGNWLECDITEGSIFFDGSEVSARGEETYHVSRVITYY